MKILGINTATAFGSVGIIDGDRVMGEYSLNVPTTHSERLMACIDRLLTDTEIRLEEIAGFSVALGPGSFTGLRIGVSTAKGLAFATGRPVAGVSTLEALAVNLLNCTTEICPILDARKREVYAALFRANRHHRLTRVTPDMVISPQNLIKEIQGPVTFLGDGVEVYGGFLKRKLGRRASFAAPELAYIHGAVLARIGLKQILKEKTVDLTSFTPRYIRRSEAEIKYAEKAKEKNRKEVGADGRKRRGSHEKAIPRKRVL
jgi:tRNA threonylcarbamoyladenosine biosynthesis protein TsaB